MNFFRETSNLHFSRLTGERKTVYAAFNESDPRDGSTAHEGYWYVSRTVTGLATIDYPQQ